MRDETYTEKEILSLIKGARNMHDDTHTLPLDHDKRIGVYDVEMIKDRLKTKEQKELMQEILEGSSIKDAARTYGVSKKTIERRLQDIAKQLGVRLNGEETDMQEVKVIKERKGIPTVIEVNGLRYILNSKDTYQPKEKKPK